MREEEKSFQELAQSCTTLQWLPTPVGKTGVLLRKEITSLLRRKHFNCFVVSRSHLGLAEVESSAGTSVEKLTSLETGKFSGSSYVLLIAVLEMNILSNITAIGSILSYICVINLLSLTLCTPAVLLFSMDKYFIGLFPFSSRQLSPCHKG